MVTKTPPILKIILTGCIVILAYDTVGSLASVVWDFPYSSLTMGSFLIYGIFGFVGTRYVNIKNGILAAGIVGLVEATIGWAISWIIGPGQPQISFGAFTIVITVIVVTITAVIIGLLGSGVAILFSRLFERKLTT